jgi:hypothetical protein
MFPFVTVREIGTQTGLILLPNTRDAPVPRTPVSKVLKSRSTTNNKGKPSTMDDTTFQSLQEALAHHNEWDGRNIILSVNESPELEELVEIDLAQCIGNANKQHTPHSKASQPFFSHMVRVFMKRPFRYFDISIFDISTFRYSYTSVFPHFDMPTFRYADISIFRHFDIPTFRAGTKSTVTLP